MCSRFLYFSPTQLSTMSYYKYMVSSYQSSLPLSSSRSYRNSSVERSFTTNLASNLGTSRFVR